MLRDSTTEPYCFLSFFAIAIAACCAGFAEKLSFLSLSTAYIIPECLLLIFSTFSELSGSPPVSVPPVIPCFIDLVAKSVDAFLT